MARPPPRIGIAGCPLQHLVPALIFFRRVAPTPLLCTLTFSVDLSHLASSVLQSGLISLDQLSRIRRELKIGTRLNPNFADLSVKSMGFQNSDPVRKKKNRTRTNPPNFAETQRFFVNPGWMPFRLCWCCSSSHPMKDEKLMRIFELEGEI
jgi:hypothetical protein